jgi:ABC-type Fe3+/spermidine/putrescine transport system ATPase subunit
VERVDAEAAVVRLVSGDRVLAAPLGLVAGRSVELSIRPEAISIAGSNGHLPDDPSHVNGRVEQVAYLGGTVRYLVRMPGGLTLSAVAPKTADRYGVGSDVDLAWSAREALVLAGSSPRTEEAAS